VSPAVSAAACWRGFRRGKSSRGDCAPARRELSQTELARLRRRSRGDPEQAQLHQRGSAKQIPRKARHGPRLGSAGTRLSQPKASGPTRKPAGPDADPPVPRDSSNVVHCPQPARPPTDPETLTSRAPQPEPQVTVIMSVPDAPDEVTRGPTGGHLGGIFWPHTHRIHERKIPLTWEPPYGIEP
jgi:hypothetical protein